MLKILLLASLIIACNYGGDFVGIDDPELLALGHRACIGAGSVYVTYWNPYFPDIKNERWVYCTCPNQSSGHVDQEYGMLGKDLKKDSFGLYAVIWQNFLKYNCHSGH